MRCMDYGTYIQYGGRTICQIVNARLWCWSAISKSKSCLWWKLVQVMHIIVPNNTIPSKWPGEVTTWIIHPLCTKTEPQFYRLVLKTPLRPPAMKKPSIQMVTASVLIENLCKNTFFQHLHLHMTPFLDGSERPRRHPKESSIFLKIWLLLFWGHVSYYISSWF